MLTKAYKETASRLVHTPLLWIPGLYVGIITGLFIWLEFTDGMFIAGKVVMLSLIAFPFFIGMINIILETGEKNAKILLSSSLRTYFPITLPCIILAGIIVIMALLLSIPLSIMGFGEDQYVLTGLILGITIPAFFFSLYLDNVAVCEKTRIFDTLKRSMELVGRDFLGSLGYVVISGIFIMGVSFFGAFLWGILLADHFTPFVEMNLTVQQETFSHYSFADWQNLIGPEGAIYTALIFGLIAFILTPFLLVFKYQCYQEISDETPVVYGEFDEKGRWYKY